MARTTEINKYRIQVYVHILMQEKPQLQKEFYTTQESRIKLEKFMMEMQLWTGWSKNKKEE